MTKWQSASIFKPWYFPVFIIRYIVKHSPIIFMPHSSLSLQGRSFGKKHSGRYLKTYLISSTTVIIVLVLPDSSRDVRALLFQSDHQGEGLVVKPCVYNNPIRQSHAQKCTFKRDYSIPHCTVSLDKQICSDIDDTLPTPENQNSSWTSQNCFLLQYPNRTAWHAKKYDIP